MAPSSSADTPASRKPFVVALSGGIASGKSALGKRLMALGIPEFDADIISRELVQPGQPALSAIVERFGRDILQPDGQLDRRALRSLVFSDDPARAEQAAGDRRDLEAIIHPEVRTRLRQQVHDSRAAVVVLSIPLLVEAQADYTWVDRVLMVDVPESLQVSRLCQRDGVNDAIARHMLAAQSTREQRLALADDVVVNDGPLAALDLAARRLAAFYRGLATN